MTTVIDNNALAEKTVSNQHGTFTVCILSVERQKSDREIHVDWSVRHNAHAVRQKVVLERHEPFLDDCGVWPGEEFLPNRLASKLTAHLEVEFDKDSQETTFTFECYGCLLDPQVICWNEDNKLFDQQSLTS